MNRQFISLLFSILLASTFIHEIRTKTLPEVRPVRAQIHDRTKRSAGSGLNLQVVASLLVVVNSTANTALVIDVKANLFVLLNGSTGSCTCLNPSTNKGSYIPKGVWNANNTSLEDFLNSLSNGLSGLLKKVGGTVISSVNSLTNNILKDVTSILCSLLSTVDQDLTRDITQALGLVDNIVNDLLSLLNGVLDGVLELVGDIVIDLSGDLAGLTNTLKGLGKILDVLGEDLSSLLNQGVDLNLDNILGALNGLECLIYLITQLGSEIDLTPLADLLGNLPSLCTLISQLGGNVFAGLNGIFQILGQIGNLLDNPSNLVALINCLLAYVTQNTSDLLNGLESDLNDLLNELLDTLEKVGATDALSDLVDLVNNILNNTLKLAGCNLSNIIDQLLNALNSSGLLSVVCSILASLTPIVTTVQAIPYLLLVLICKLNSPTGIQQLLKLNIPINLNLNSIVGGILKYVLLLAKNLVSSILNGNLYNALAQLPIVGDIVKALNSALNKSSNGKLDLKTLLGANSIVQTLLKGVLQVVSGLNLGVSSSSSTQASSVLSNCASAGSFLSLDLNASITIG